jgi:peptidoglycan-associated lipoprotein
MRWRRTSAGIAAIAVVATLASSCAHVSRKDLDAELTTLRGDLVQRMDQGENALGARVDGLAGDVAALRTELAAMQRDFGVKVEELEASLRVHVPVHFGFDQAEVEPSGREVLDRFAGVAGRYYPGARVTVEGFTDPSGSAAYNLRLGQRRADAVRSYLVSQGMAAERVRAVSYGESVERLVAPGAQGPGTAGWENRRVVLVIEHDGAAVPSGLGFRVPG